jgi:hypothetical protein
MLSPAFMDRFWFTFYLRAEFSFYDITADGA